MRSKLLDITVERRQHHAGPDHLQSVTRVRNQERGWLAAHALHQCKKRGHLGAFFIEFLALFLHFDTRFCEFFFDFRQSLLRQAKSMGRLYTPGPHPGTVRSKRHLISQEFLLLSLDLIEPQFAPDIKLAGLFSIDLCLCRTFFARTALRTDMTLNALVMPPRSRLVLYTNDL